MPRWSQPPNAPCMTSKESFTQCIDASGNSRESKPVLLPQSRAASRGNPPPSWRPSRRRHRPNASSVVKLAFRSKQIPGEPELHRSRRDCLRDSLRNAQGTEITGTLVLFSYIASIVSPISVQFGTGLSRDILNRTFAANFDCTSACRTKCPTKHMSFPRSPAGIVGQPMIDISLLTPRKRGCEARGQRGDPLKSCTPLTLGSVTKSTACPGDAADHRTPDARGPSHEDNGCSPAGDRRASIRTSVTSIPEFSPSHQRHAPSCRTRVADHPFAQSRSSNLIASSGHRFAQRPHPRNDRYHPIAMNLCEFERITRHAAAQSATAHLDRRHSPPCPDEQGSIAPRARQPDAGRPHRHHSGQHDRV
jgi:hypothetical protein